MVAIRPSTLKVSGLRSRRSSTLGSIKNIDVSPVNQKVPKNGSKNQLVKVSLLNRRNKTSRTLSSEQSTSKKVKIQYSVNKKSFSNEEASYPTPPLSSPLTNSYPETITKAKRFGTVKSKDCQKKGSNKLKQVGNKKGACSCSLPRKRGRPRKVPIQCTVCIKNSEAKEKATRRGKATRVVRSSKVTRVVRGSKVKVTSKKTVASSSPISNNKLKVSRKVKTDASVPASIVSPKTIKLPAAKKLLNKKAVVGLPKKKMVVSPKPKVLKKTSDTVVKKPRASTVESTLKDPTPSPPLIPKKVPTLSEYEIKRLEVIRQNMLFMESLNLGGGSSLSLSSISIPALPKPTSKYIKPPSSKPKSSTIETVPRKSQRLVGKPAPRYSLPEGFEEEKEFLRKKPSKSPSTQSGNKRSNYIQKGRNGARKRAPQELDPEEKLLNIQKSHDVNYIKKPLPETEAIDVSKFKSGCFATHHIGGCLSEPLLEGDSEVGLITRLSEIKQVTSQPVKLIGSVPTTLDVHSDPQRFVVAMGNRGGEVAVWDATSAILEEGDECINNMGYLIEGASIMHHQAYQSRVWSLKFQPEYSAKLLQAGGDGSLRSFDMVKECLTPVCQLPVHGEFMTGLGFVNPQTVAFTTSHGFFGQHDLRTASHVCNSSPLNNTAHLLWCLSVNPANQHIIAVGSSDRTLSIWDTRYLTTSEPSPVTELNYTAFVTSVDWDPRGNRLAVFAYDNVIRIFDYADSLTRGNIQQSIVETAQYSHEADPWRKGVAVQARFIPSLDGRVVAAGAMGPKVNYYSSTSNRSLGYFDASHYPAASPGILAFHPRATLGSHPFGSGMVHGTLTGRVFILT